MPQLTVKDRERKVDIPIEGKSLVLRDTDGVLRVNLEHTIAIKTHGLYPICYRMFSFLCALCALYVLKGNSGVLRT